MTRDRTITIVRLTALPGVDRIKALRALLKRARRTFGLRAVSIEDEPTSAATTPRAAPADGEGNGSDAPTRRGMGAAGDANAATPLYPVALSASLRSRPTREA